MVEQASNMYPLSKKMIIRKKGVTVLNQVWKKQDKFHSSLRPENNLWLKAVSSGLIRRRVWPYPLRQPSWAKEEWTPEPPSESFILHFILSLSLSVQTCCVSADTKFSHVISWGSKSSDRRVPHRSFLASAEMVNWVHDSHASSL